MNNIVLAVLLIMIIATGCAYDTPTETNKGDPLYIVTAITEQLSHPWGMDFINSTTIIVTQKHGAISIVDTPTGQIIDLQGAPSVDSTGQGGMLDVALADDWVYMTYSAPYEAGITTHLARAVLNLETHTLENLEVLYSAYPAMQGGSHFGSRILIKDDYIFFTVGDRGDKNFGAQHVSQNTSNTLGTTIRLYTNGSIPHDNPFVGNDGVDDSIYTYGHRNVQGMALHPRTGDIWQSEHGEQDGDSINILQAGGNYGWPISHYGCQYGTSKPIGDYPHQNPDVINPIYYWECNSGGFPPAGMAFYDGTVFEQWQGNLFVGNLLHQYLGRFEVNGRQLIEKEPLLSGLRWRIRDVGQSPDGYLYVLVDALPGGLYRLEPR
jgi:aldose sugar dehydrogenase